MSERGRPRNREDDRASWIWGVRPVQELLDRRRAEVERVMVARERTGGLGWILRTAREAGIPVSHVPRDLLSRKLGGRANHQGVAAQVSPVAYADAGELCRAAARRDDGLLVLVDRVEDAGNLGAILRSAAGAGADGVLLSTEGTAGLGGAASKTSAGAAERVAVAREPRPAARLDELREAGFAAVALDPRGDRPWDRVDLRGRVVLVVGGEARGPRPGVLRATDHRVAIPLARGVESLNVAVAAGVLLFELVRQRRGGEGGLETEGSR